MPTISRRRAAIVTGLVSTLGAIAWVAKAGSHDASDHPQEHHAGHATGELPVTTPWRTDTQLTRDYVGQIRAIRHIEVRALERGYLEEAFVDEGRSVTRGQRMFQIMPTLYQAELDKARAEAEAARIEYENTRRLAEKNVVSQNELALAKAKLDKAGAEVALSEAHWRLTTIAAPFDGIMGLLEVRPGSLLEEGELLTTLSDNSSMWVYFNVTEAEYLAYASRPAGSPAPGVQLVLADDRVFDQPGTIETSAADFNNETGTIAFRATFKNPAGLLRHGETGNVRLTTPLKDALIIPQLATFEVLDHRYVFVVDAEGVCHQRKVSIAAELPHLFVIEDGVAAGERILIDGLRKVRDGQRITTRYQDPEQVVSKLDVPAD